MERLRQKDLRAEAGGAFQRGAGARGCRKQQQAEAFMRRRAGAFGKRRGKGAHGAAAKAYAHEALSGLFVKTTVSELKKAGMREELEEGRQLFAEEEVVPYVPDFVQETEKKSGGTARGNAYHRFMERFPFSQKGAEEGWTVTELQALLKEKTESRELSAADAEAVNPYKIRAFFKRRAGRADGRSGQKRAAFQGTALCAGHSGKQHGQRVSQGGDGAHTGNHRRIF